MAHVQSVQESGAQHCEGNEHRGVLEQVECPSSLLAAYCHHHLVNITLDCLSRFEPFTPHIALRCVDRIRIFVMSHLIIRPVGAGIWTAVERLLQAVCTCSSWT
jgi:hypothetical protein